MIAIDLERHAVLDAESLKRHLFAAVSEQRSRVVAVEAAPANLVEAPTGQMHALFGYGREDLKLVIAPMARDGKEAVWSMGDDTPVSALARVPRSIYSYFRQRFAQVTNPPIDPLREDLMMSLRTVLGRRPSLCPAAVDTAGDQAAATPGIIDVRSAAPGNGLDGTPYKDFP